MKRMLMILIFIFVVSCSSAEMKIYSIYMPISNEAISSSKRGETLYLTVRAPRHLEQPYIIFRNSPYELNLSTYSKWEASPSDIIKQNMMEVLTSKKIYREVKLTRPQANEQVEVMIIDLKDFSRYDEGQISYGMLQFAVTLRDKNNKEIYQKDFKVREQLEDRTYLSLAKKISQVLMNIAQDISNSIAKL